VELLKDDVFKTLKVF
jgi:hypothetical protein